MLPDFIDELGSTQGGRALDANGLGKSDELLSR